MPIRPENRSLYPPDWPEIRQKILRRAGGKCELCGAVNYQPHPVTGSKVVLTIMHLDHDPTNNDPANLKAGCQKCHNAYDAPMRAAGRKRRRREQVEKTQTKLL